MSESPGAASRGQLVDHATGEVLDLRSGSLCQSCARSRFTCCQTEYGVSVTLFDAARLVAATGRAPGDFLQLTTLPDAYARGLRRDPWFRRLFLGRRLLQLQHRGEVDCVFLGPAGCTVKPDRPRLCRLYPFWFAGPRRGQLEVAWDQVSGPEAAEASPCLVVNALWEHPELALHVIGETPESLARQARRLAAEAGWQRRVVRGLLRRVPATQLELADLEAWIARAGELLARRG